MMRIEPRLFQTVEDVEKRPPILRSPRTTQSRGARNTARSRWCRCTWSPSPGGTTPRWSRLPGCTGRSASVRPRRAFKTRLTPRERSASTVLPRASLASSLPHGPSLGLTTHLPFAPPHAPRRRSPVPDRRVRNRAHDREHVGEDHDVRGAALGSVQVRHADGVRGLSPGRREGVVYVRERERAHGGFARRRGRAGERAGPEHGRQDGRDRHQGHGAGVGGRVRRQGADGV